MADELWFKDANYGRLGQVARQEGGLGNELKHAAKFTSNYWKKKVKGAKAAMTISPRIDMNKNTRNMLSDVD